MGMVVLVFIWRALTGRVSHCIERSMTNESIRGEARPGNRR
jgi:hypothetical protein